MFRNPAVLSRTFSTVYRRPHIATRRYASESTATSRIARIESRLPRFLQRIVSPLRHAPISHITAFLVLHELTAIVPLFGLAAVFHYANWLPPYISEGQWVKEGTERFGRYLRKKGWISDDDAKGRWYGRGEGGVRIVIELATAYAITKALLPLRLMLSVWATPWFARWTVLPFTNRVRQIWSKRPAAKKSAPAAGTGAVGGGVVPERKNR